MSLDEAKEEDKVFEEGGVTYVINEQLFDLAKPINIDFVTTPRGSGFSINSNVSGGGGCGGGCCGG
jgi:Fe-S cluster assembly iron-binding protein IscA